jgi:hypothetical protein
MAELGSGQKKLKWASKILTSCISLLILRNILKIARRLFFNCINNHCRTSRSVAMHCSTGETTILLCLQTPSTTCRPFVAHCELPMLREFHKIACRRWIVDLHVKTMQSFRFLQTLKISPVLSLVPQQILTIVYYEFNDE